MDKARARVSISGKRKRVRLRQARSALRLVQSILAGLTLAAFSEQPAAAQERPRSVWGPLELSLSSGIQWCEKVW